MWCVHQGRRLAPATAHAIRSAAGQRVSRDEPRARRPRLLRPKQHPPRRHLRRRRDVHPRAAQRRRREDILARFTQRLRGGLQTLGPLCGNRRTRSPDDSWGDHGRAVPSGLPCGRREYRRLWLGQTVSVVGRQGQSDRHGRDGLPAHRLAAADGRDARRHRAARRAVLDVRRRVRRPLASRPHDARLRPAPSRPRRSSSRSPCATASGTRTLIAFLVATVSLFFEPAKLSLIPELVEPGEPDGRQLARQRVDGRRGAVRARPRRHHRGAARLTAARSLFDAVTYLVSAALHRISSRGTPGAQPEPRPTRRRACSPTCGRASRYIWQHAGAARPRRRLLLRGRSAGRRRSRSATCSRCGRTSTRGRRSRCVSRARHRDHARPPARQRPRRPQRVRSRPDVKFLWGLMTFGASLRARWPSSLRCGRRYRSCSFGGVANMWFQIPMATMLQQQTRESLRGRVFAARMTVVRVFTVVGLVGAGARPSGRHPGRGRGSRRARARGRPRRLGLALPSGRPETHAAGLRSPMYRLRRRNRRRVVHGVVTMAEIDGLLQVHGRAGELGPASEGGQPARRAPQRRLVVLRDLQKLTPEQTRVLALGMMDERQKASFEQSQRVRLRLLAVGRRPLPRQRLPPARQHRHDAAPRHDRARLDRGARPAAGRAHAGRRAARPRARDRARRARARRRRSPR